MIQVSTITTIKELSNKRHGTLAFVPTMGNLHAGHLSLVRAAKAKADQVVVSIFVNPLQFSPGEDLDRYPRTLERDLELLAGEGVDWVFTPSEQDMYPEGRSAHTQVVVPKLAHQLCGASRPNFFTSIASVVLKLFLIIEPDVAVFGQKDYQQFLVIDQLRRDFHLPIELIMAPTVREADGLALSSRNGYLSSEERALAPRLYQALLKVQKHLGVGGSSEQALLQARELLEPHFSIDYLLCARASDLALHWEDNDPLVILGAAMLGKTRLIDNIL